jgi:hypothetical protein
VLQRSIRELCGNIGEDPLQANLAEVQKTIPPELPKAQPRGNNKEGTHSQRVSRMIAPSPKKDGLFGAVMTMANQNKK